MLRAVVRLFAAAQNNVAIAVARRVDDGGVTPFSHGEEAVRCACGVDGVNRHFDGAVGAVLKTNRAREAGSQLTVHLGFGGARANRAPAHQIRHILRGDHIEELTCRRQPAVVNFQQQFARNAQAVINAEAVIHMRIVNQPLPANGGARFFKIDAHHDFQFALQFVTQCQQTGSILFCRHGIVNGTGSDNH